MKKSDIAREYVERFPNHGNLTLARKINKEIPGLFPNLDAARSAVRYVRGSKGNHNRKYALNKSNFKDMSHKRENPYGLPPEEKNDVEPYILNAKNVLVMSDLHFPFQSNDSITVVLDYAKKKKVDAIVVNGDMLDFYSLSRFEKDPRQKSFAYELDCGRNFFDILRQNFGDIQIIFKEGNHEERYEKFLRLKAPELIDTDEFNLDILLHANKYKITYIKNKKIIELGHLNILHGHEIPSGSPVNPARGLYNRTKANALIGHHHRTSEHSEPDLLHNVVDCWSVGCLCDLTPKYMPYNKWNHGAAIVEMDGDDFMVNNFKIINGKVR